MEITTNDTAENEITQHQVENKETGGEMYFDELTITGDSDYDILEEEHEIISLNDIFWFKVNKEICQGKLHQIPFSDRKEGIQY